MEEQNNFWIGLVASLKKAQSKKQIQSDAKNLGDIYVPLIGKLSPKSKTIAQLKKDLSGVEIPVNLTGKVNKKGVVTSVQQATKQAQATANKSTIQVSMNLKKDKLINDIKVFGQQNTKLFKDVNMTAKYNSLLDSAKLASSGKEIQNLRMQLSAMRSELKANNLAGLTLGDTFKKTFKRATELFTGTGGIMLLTRQLRNTWEEALTLDKAYTDLIKVQNELTRSDYPDYLDRCNKKAQELATTQKALIESVTEFSKSGYNLSDSNALAEQATILSNVGDMSATDSSKAIISGVQAYDLIDGYEDVEKKAEALIDKYNEIGNTASITTAEIAQGVQSVGSVFADANTSVDKFIALLAAGNRQYQDADALALGLRTSALRIRGCTTELELMGEETDGVAESTAKLEEKIKALTNVNGSGGVRILEADGETFRSIYDIFLDISKVYKDMSDVDQSALLELIAGKHRASAISATLNNMSEAQEIYQRSLEATGSAQAEYDKYLSSSEASLNQFKATMTETYQSVLDGSTVKGILDCGNATIKFVNSLGLVESTLKGFVAIGIVKTITTLSTAFKASAIQASNFGVALNTVKDMSAMARGTKQYTTALNTLKMVSAGLSETQLKQVLASKALSDADRIAILRTTGLTKAQAQAKLAQMGLVQSTKAQTTAQKTATASTFSLTAAVKGFGASLKAAFLSNPIGIAIMAISTAFGAITSAIDSANQKADEARQKAKDAADTASNLSSELSELTGKYLTLSEAVQTDKSSKEELMTVQEELIKKLGIEGESIDTLISKYGSLDEAIKQLTLDELGNMENDLIAGVKATEEELKSIGKDYEHWYSLTNRNLLSSSGDDAVRAYEVLEDAGLISSGSYGTGGGSVILTNDDSTVEGILANYQTLQDAMKALRESGEFTETELKDNPVFSQVYNRAKEMEEYVNAYNDAITDLNQNVAQQQMLGALKGMELPDTEEEFNAFRDNLVKTAQSSGEFIGSQEDIEEAINSYLATVPQFAGYYGQLSDAISNTTDVATQSAKLFSSFDNTNLGERLQHANKLFKEGELTHKQYFDSLQNEIDNFDASNFTDSLEDANKASQQFFTDSVQQSASGLSDLINKFDAGEMSVSEYLDGYLAIGETLSTLADNLQENSSAWDKNGEAMSDAVSSGLDSVQSDLDNAMSTITGYKDSIYSLEQIMTGAVKAGSDEFTAHANVIAQDLANIVSSGGEMASEVANTLGTTTSEIASNLTKNVSNQSLAAQAIAANTNIAISDMATSVANIFTTLGNAISNFNVDISFSKTSGSLIDAITGNGELKFNLSASGETLSTIGDAISAFGETLALNIQPQLIEAPDFSLDVDEYTPDVDTLKNYNDELDRLKNSSKGASDATDALTDSLKKQKEVLTEQKSELEALHGAIIDYIDDEIDDINDKTDAIDKQNEKLRNQLDIYDDIISAVTNNIDIEIDAIDDKIDKLRDANDEEEKALALEEAKRKNLEANSRKTKLVYQEGKGFVYEKDEKAIKESESELENLQEEALIDSLEKEKKLLDENKQKWLEIVDAREKALQTSLASKYFGSNWRDTTLNPSDEMIGKLQGDYVGTQIKIEQNDSRIEELNKEKEFWENEKKLWQDALDEYEKQQNRARLESFFGSEVDYQLLNNSASWRKQYVQEYSRVCSEIEALEERIKTSSETTTSSVESGANKIAGSADKVREATNGIKFEIDHSALEEAKLKLERLDSQIAFGQQGLETARNAVANFIKEYEAADGCTTITEGLAQAVLELNGIYGNTGDSMAGMISGINSDIESFEVQSRTLSENLTEVDTKMQSIGNSEEQVEETVNTELSNVEITISNLLTKLGELQTKLGEISLSRTEIESIADEELLDTSAVVDGVHTKVGEIQTAITTLMESITPLHGALDTLMEKMTTLDEFTLSNVISAFGGASGGEGGESKESGSKSSSKGKKGSEGESGGGSGLLGAVKAVDEAIGSVDNEESLLGKLQALDDKTLENIIAQFGLSGENGDSEGANLLNAINAVSTAIVGGGKDDENSLIASIERLGSDPTIEHVTTVSDSFQTLHDTINECVKKVEELSKAIESIPSSTATVGVNGGKSSGRAKGGIITKEDAGDFDYIAKSLGEDHMVALTEGEAVIPKETVSKNPEAIDSLLSGQKLDLEALVNRDIVLQRATPLDNYSMFEKYKDWIIPDSVIMSRLNLPSQDFSKLGVVNNNQQQTVIQINGDLSFPNIKSGNDAELLLKDLSNMANKARQRSARR